MKREILSALRTSDYNRLYITTKNYKIEIIKINKKEYKVIYKDSDGSYRYSNTNNYIYSYSQLEKAIVENINFYELDYIKEDI
jgi:hypothetical protein